MNPSNGSSLVALRFPAARSPRTYARIVLRSWLRCAAILVIDQALAMERVCVYIFLLMLLSMSSGNCADGDRGLVIAIDAIDAPREISFQAAHHFPLCFSFPNASRHVLLRWFMPPEPDHHDTPQSMIEFAVPATIQSMSLLASTRRVNRARACKRRERTIAMTSWEALLR